MAGSCNIEEENPVSQSAAAPQSHMQPSEGALLPIWSSGSLTTASVTRKEDIILSRPTIIVIIITAPPAVKSTEVARSTVSNSPEGCYTPSGPSCQYFAMSDRPFPSFYRALDPDVDEIRLLTTISVDAEDRVVCRLITVPIHERPSYVAVSYVWGETTDWVPTQVDGQAFHATPNLAQALRYIPRHWEARYPGRALAELRVWADAVCINQRDLEERARQVRLMGSIFSGAELVMCCLAHETRRHNSNYRTFSEDEHDHALSTAFRTIELINRELRLVEQEVGVNTLCDIGLGDKRLVQWLAKHPELIETTPGYEWTRWNRNWEALYHLSRNQYWTRVWVFQEIVLARDALLICKSSCISLTDVVNRVWLWFDLLRWCSISAPSFMSPGLWQSLVSGRAVMKHTIALSIESWRWRSRGTPESSWVVLGKTNVLLTATDPKDKVYGMLGITGIDLRPDYSDQTSVAEVFRDMTAAWLQDYASIKEDTAGEDVESGLKELWFLRYAGLRQHCDHVSCQQFSSWVPNFPHFDHDFFDYFFLFVVNADYGVFSDEQSRTLSYIQDSSLFVTGLRVGWVHETYHHVRKASDVFGFMSDLFRKEVFEFSRVESKRRLLRNLFELLHLERVHGPCSTSLDYLESACAFVWAVLNAKPELERDCTATTLSCIPTFNEVSQYRAGMEMMALRPDSNVEFFCSLRETFLDLEDASDQDSGAKIDSGETSSSANNDGPLAWLQVLLDSEATSGLPNDSKFAAYCQRMVDDLKFMLNVGSLFRTSRGDFGLAPRESIHCGDILCVLKGCSSLVALRKTEDHFLYVGETQVQGMMEGQAAQLLKEGLAELRQFELK